MIEFGNLLNYDKTPVYGDTSTSSFWYWGNQTLEYDEEIKLNLFCNFQFMDYPFDSHICRIEYGDDIWGTSLIKFKSAIVWYGDKNTTVGKNLTFKPLYKILFVLKAQAFHSVLAWYFRKITNFEFNDSK